MMVVVGATVVVVVGATVVVVVGGAAVVVVGTAVVVVVGAFVVVVCGAGVVAVGDRVVLVVAGATVVVAVATLVMELGTTEVSEVGSNGVIVLATGSPSEFRARLGDSPVVGTSGLAAGSEATGSVPNCPVIASAVPPMTNRATTIARTVTVRVLTTRNLRGAA